MVGSGAMRRALSISAEALGMEVKAGSEQLGVDSAGGARIVRTKLEKRKAAIAKRKVKVSFLKRAGANVFKVVRAGILPGIAYGAGALGAPPRLLEQARVYVSSSLSGQAMGVDRALRLALHKADPLKGFTEAPVLKWASAVFDGDVPREVLERAWRAASVRAVGLRSLWRGVRGPASGLLATLARIGWSWPEATVLRTRCGRLLRLTELPPKAVAKLAGRAAEETVLRAWAEERPQLGLAKPYLAPLQSWANRAAPGDVAAARAYISEGCWTQDKYQPQSTN